MQLHPNKSVLDARVVRVTRAADGVGADVVVDVRACRAADGFEDFIGAAVGAELTLFAAEPEAVEAGASYRFTARVLGGPNNERIVIEAAEPVRGR